MSMLSDEVNFLVYRYLIESGFHHSAFTFGLESHIGQSNVNGSLVPPGALINIIQKGLQYIESELCINDDGTLIDDLDLIPQLPLIDAVIPEAIAQRAASIYREIAKKAEVVKSVPAIEGRMDFSGEDDILCLRGHEREVFSCCWSPDSKLLASNDADSIAAIWRLDVDSKDNLTNGESPMASKTNTHSVLLLDHKERTNGSVQTGEVTCIQWSPDGGRLATAWAVDNNIRIWMTDGSLQAVLTGHWALVFNIKWNRKADHLISSGMDNRCIVWDAVSWQKKQVFERHTGPVNDIDWKDDTSFASGATDKMVYVWSVGTDKPTQVCAGHTGEINSVRWDGDGEVLASCSDDTLIKLWCRQQDDASNLSGHTKEVTLVEWNPTVPNMLASASDDMSVRLWNTVSMQCVHAFNRHLEPVNSISFSPDGAFIASGTLDGLINVWKTQPGTCIFTHRDRSGVFNVQWSPDGHRIAFTVLDKLVKVLEARKFIGDVS